MVVFEKGLVEIEIIDAVLAYETEEGEAIQELGNQEDNAEIKSVVIVDVIVAFVGCSY